jgi:hypothetical protein
MPGPRSRTSGRLWRLVAPLAALALAGVIAVLGLQREDAGALAACVSHTNTEEELQFNGLLQSWRDANIEGSYSLTVSSSLNAAAYGYAVYLANTPGAAGHYADGGAQGPAWADRAIQCGYPSGIAAGGEGLAVVESSGPVSVSPQQALNVMTSEQGGGVWVPSDVGAPVKCVGTGKAVSADGRKVAWVTLLFATFSTCPQAVSATPASSPPGATPSPSPSKSPSPSPSASASKSPSPSPSPSPGTHNWPVVFAANGWSLWTLPPGDIEQILGPAAGCFVAVYQQDGDGWLRYAPGVPDYANNLHYSDGGPFWILGSDRICGLITL